MSASGFPAVSADQPPDNVPIEAGGGVRGEQRVGVGHGQAGELQDRKPVKRARNSGSRSLGEHEGTPFRLQSSSPERQGVDRFAVDPLRVVDHAEERAERSALGGQCHGGQPDHEAVGRRPRPEPERGLHRDSLRLGQLVDPFENRCQQPMECRVTEVPFRLDSGEVDNLQIGCRAHEVLEERGLADAGLATDHHRRRLTSARSIENSVDLPAFLDPADQIHGRRVGAAIRCDNYAVSGIRARRR